jgi:PAS domain S-box-containing protein
MPENYSRFRSVVPEIIITTTIVILGFAFVWYMYNNVKSQNINNALQVGNSVVAALPVEKIAQLTASPDDTALVAYKDLKAALQNIIKENKSARFAYLYEERTGKYYFLLDSEPTGSSDYSPPGQEFSEVNAADKQPFKDSKSTVTEPLTDRWGTWVSVLVPIRDKASGKTLAVFGMDINAKLWVRAIWLQVAESSLLVIILMLLALITSRYLSKNRHLENEIKQRIFADKALHESETRYRLIYENASIGIYQTTPDGKVLLSNMALLKILGYKTFDELKERNIEEGEFDPTYSRSEFKRLMELEGEIHGLEMAWKRQDGTLVYIRENAKAIRDANGKIEYYDGTIEDITDRKLAEKALQYSEERFRQITEQSREVVWEVDETGLYTYVSPLSANVLGYTPDELVGKKHYYDLHPAQSQEDFKKATLEVFHRKESFHDYVNQIVNGSGKSIWVMTNGVAILGDNNELIGYRGAYSDITERIQRENLLKKLTLAVEQSPVSIVITSVDGAIEYGNPKACETTGYTVEELLGKNPRVLKSGSKPSSDYKELWDTIISGKIWHGEFHNIRKNGELYWESASISPIFDNEGNIINFLAVKEDITNQKMLISELQEAKNRAESSDRLKSAFIKNISHEIRTPLNGIVGMSEQILKTSLPQQNKEILLNLIKESSARLINTVNSYLDISLIVSGNIEVHIQPVSLNNLMNDLKSEMQHECAGKDLILQLMVPENTDSIEIKTDPEIFVKIMRHLLENAVKFTEAGYVAFGYKIKNEVVEFYCKDTGIGIEMSFIPHIFESFSQADVSDTRAYEGSGLGLSITQHLVQLLSGEIRVESEIDKGSTFYLTFPEKDFIVQNN